MSSGCVARIRSGSSSRSLDCDHPCTIGLVTTSSSSDSNGKLARAYQLVEELRVVLPAPDRRTLYEGLWRILRRTERRDNVPMRKLHESLREHFDQIVALGRAAAPDRTHRGTQQQLGDARSSRPRLQESCLPARQTTLHHGQSSPQLRRHQALPRPRTPDADSEGPREH